MNAGECSRQRGSLSVFVAVMATFLVAMTTVAVEGSRRLAHAARAEDLASEAARAAAATLDPRALAAGEIRIDIERAHEQVDRVLAASGEDTRFRLEIAPTGDRARVDVILEADSVLPLFDVRGHGSHTARSIDPGALEP